MKLNPAQLQKFFLIIALFALTGTSSAATYYLDATNGNDANSGLFKDNAWKTIDKIRQVASTFEPGDVVAFKKGEIWNGERLRINNHPSGTAENPITYTSCGNAGDRPIININVEQSNTNSDWNYQGNNIWSRVVNTGSRYFKDGSELLRAPKGMNDKLGMYGIDYYRELTADGTGFNLFVYGDPGGSTWKWDKYTYALQLTGANYINVIGLDIRGGSNASITIKDNHNWLVKDCNIGENAGYGMVMRDSSDIIVENVIFDSNYDVDRPDLPSGSSGIDYSSCEDAIFVGAGSHRITVRNSFFINWPHASFGSNSHDSSRKITHVKFYNNELTSPGIIYGGRITYSGFFEDGEFFNNYIHDISVALQLGGSRNHFHHNIIDGVSDSPLKTEKIGIGIWMLNYNIQVKDNIIENNIIANTDSHGFEIYSINWEKNYEDPQTNTVYGEFSGNIFRNNILYNCGLTDNGIAIQFHKDQSGQKIYNNTIENNLIFNDSTSVTSLFQYGGVTSDVATFNTQDPDIRNNIAGDPLFVDIATGNYHLLEASPAINAGEVSLATLDYGGNSIPSSNVDIGIYEFMSTENGNKPLPLVWLALDESSGAIAEDLSGNDHLGTVYGATWTTGKVSGALSFDGSDDYVSIDDNFSLDITNKLTLAAWVNVDNLDSYMEVVNRYWNCFTIGVNLGSSGKFSISYRNENNALKSYVSSTTITPGVWYHVTALIEAGGRVKLYVNGTQEVDEAFIGTALRSGVTSEITIGAGGSNGDYYHFAGNIDDVKIYDTVLNESEIVALNNPLPAALVWLALDESSGAIADDLSGNDHVGTVHGATWTAGIISGALSFNGSDDYVSIDDDASLDITDKLTLAAWVNVDNLDSYMEVVNRYWNCFTIGVNLGSSGKFSISYRNENNVLKSYVGSTTITPGVWYHVTALIEAGGRVKLYVNGIQEVDEAFIGTALRSGVSNEITIGAGGSDGDYYHFAGKIDDVRIYDTVLSESEIVDMNN